MVIKASKKIRDLVYRLCNGLRREKDICEYLIMYHDEFTDEDKTLKSVRYHLDKLKSEGCIHFKYDGRIIDLER